MNLSQILCNIVNRPFSRAKTRAISVAVLLRSRTHFRVQEQVVTGSPIETKTNFGTKLRSGYVAGHAVGHMQPSILLILVRHRPYAGNRAGAIEFPPS
jgi:hypothetical protein